MISDGAYVQRLACAAREMGTSYLARRWVEVVITRSQEIACGYIGSVQPKVVT